MKYSNSTLLSLFAFSICILGAGIASAKPTSQLDLHLGLAHRVDHLSWSISGDPTGKNPDILSELTWDEIKIAQIKGGGKLVVHFPSDSVSLYARGSAAFGQIFKGRNQDSDYTGNQRTNEFSRSNNNAGNGNVLDASIGLGLQFKRNMKKIGGIYWIAPIVGYAYHEQNLEMADGDQTLSQQAFAPPGVTPQALGPFPGLDSTYETAWDGPWVGIDFSFKNYAKNLLNMRFEYHWVDYYAEADWNLRPNLAHPKSFEHRAKGTGIVAALGWEFPIRPRWAISFDLDFKKWSTDPGVDTLFAADGTITRTQLNAVEWDSRTVMLGLHYRFK